MKTLRLFFCLCSFALVLNTSLAFADSGDKVRLLVTKADDATAKITLDSGTYDVPISFEVGLSRADVRDAYSIPPGYAELLKHGRITIYISCGGAEFHVVHRR